MKKRLSQLLLGDVGHVGGEQSLAETRAAPAGSKALTTLTKMIGTIIFGGDIGSEAFKKKLDGMTQAPIAPVYSLDHYR